MLNQTSYVGAVGRLLISTIFLISGVGKIAAPAMTQSYIAKAGLPFPVLAYFVAIAIEVGGGILLILGYRTRIVAFVMAVYVVVTAISFHRPLSDPNQMVHFLKNIAITGGLLEIVAFGAGSMSLDYRLTRSIDGKRAS